MRAVVKILDRLEKVRRVGTGRWLSRCPAHPDKSPSLSVRELDDGRVLVHCFGGCEVGDVVVAIGLSVSDLFEKPLGHNFEASHSSIPARDLLVIVDHELTVALLILNDIVTRRTVGEDQVSRLCHAAGRIGKARDMAKPARVDSHAA